MLPEALLLTSLGDPFPSPFYRWRSWDPEVFWLHQGHMQSWDLGKGLLTAEGVLLRYTCPQLSLAGWVFLCLTHGHDFLREPSMHASSKHGKWSLLTITSILITSSDGFRDLTLDSSQILSIPIMGRCPGYFSWKVNNCSFSKDSIKGVFIKGS